VASQVLLIYEELSVFTEFNFFLPNLFWLTQKFGRFFTGHLV